MQHREGHIAGFTRQWGLKRLVWFKSFGDVSEAIAEEKRIKRWRRQWKFDLVEAQNPGWEDLWPALMGHAPFPWDDEHTWVSQPLI